MITTSPLPHPDSNYAMTYDKCYALYIYEKLLQSVEVITLGHINCFPPIGVDVGQ